MQRAREEKAAQDAYWDARREAWISKDVSRLTNTVPFSFCVREKSYRERGAPIGNVDVNFSKGKKKGRIVIYAGDDPVALANNFAKIYSLNDDMRATLTEMLSAYMNDLETSGLLAPVNNTSKSLQLNSIVGGAGSNVIDAATEVRT